MDADDELPVTPGMNELQQAWDLLEMLRSLKSSDSERGREWAIAVTQAEVLYAWISYVTGMVPDDSGDGV